MTQQGFSMFLLFLNRFIKLAVLLFLKDELNTKNANKYQHYKWIFEAFRPVLADTQVANLLFIVSFAITMFQDMVTSE